MHVHVSVADIDKAVTFYSALFATAPAVVKPDYAKWMLDDPRVNFAISTRSQRTGLDHLGIQVESQEELQDVYARLHQAGGEVIDQGQTTCCYAKSEKSWIDDPAGISWETFFTTGEATNYGDSFDREARIAHARNGASPVVQPAPATQASACCKA
jgi:predicted enzyme related to lactoylglutathione lyase